MGPGLIYGAYGYTGELVARRAVARGQRPILAGRRAEALAPLARELGLEHRAFALDMPAALHRGLAGAGAVLHCAGPFSRTAAPMALGCLRARCHYLDITGEVAVFESLAALGADARDAGVMLLPGAGFDVVPSDCLAAHVAARLPGATRLVIAFRASGRLSRGTALTAIEGLGEGGLVRRDGALTRVPLRARTLDLGDGPREVLGIPWGDLVTAWHSTAIPDIEVYVTAPRLLRALVPALRLAGPLLGSAPVRRLLAARVRAGAPGPTAEERARGHATLWAEASIGDRRAAARLDTPDTYTLTSITAVAALERALAGDAPPGFQTPSKAFGADFVLAAEGTARRDL